MPSSPTIHRDLSKARRRVDRSPTEGQKAKGNYRKGFIRWRGLHIAIENPKGSVRSGTSPSGKSWRSVMKNDYGYIKRTEGNDGDQVDVFLGPDLDSELVFVINQVDPNTRRFDEHKVVAGCTNEQQARETYLANYQKGWRGLGSIRAMSLPDFKDWLKNGDMSKRAEWEGEVCKRCRRRNVVGFDVPDEVWNRVVAGRYRVLCPTCFDEMAENKGVSYEWPDQVYPVSWSDWDKESESGPVCPGCGRKFPPGEPYPDAEMCEACERYGPSKKGKQASPQAFTNELGNPIQIDADWTPEGLVNYRLIGPTSTADNTITRSEAEHLHRLLGSLLQPPEDLSQTPPKKDKQASKDDHVPTIAVDLDGTLAQPYEEFDEECIPPPRPTARAWMQKFHDAGARLIVFTTRGDTDLIHRWLEEHQIPYDYINENPDQPPGTSDKVIADVYWDDRAVSAEDGLDASGPEVLQRLHDKLDEDINKKPQLLSVQVTQTTTSRAPDFLDFGREFAKQLGGTKQAADPIRIRATRAQLSQPQWNPQYGILENLQHNLSQWQRRGQQMARESEAVEDMQSATPVASIQRMRRALRDPHATVPDPLDRILFQ